MGCVACQCLDPPENHHQVAGNKHYTAHVETNHCDQLELSKKKKTSPAMLGNLWCDQLKSTDSDSVRLFISFSIILQLVISFSWCLISQCHAIWVGFFKSGTPKSNQVWSWSPEGTHRGPIKMPRCIGQNLRLRSRQKRHQRPAEEG